MLGSNHATGGAVLLKTGAKLHKSLFFTYLPICLFECRRATTFHLPCRNTTPYTAFYCTKATLLFSLVRDTECIAQGLKCDNAPECTNITRFRVKDRISYRALHEDS